MKSVFKSGVVALLLSLVGGANAGVDWSKAATPDVTRLAALHDYFGAKMPGSKKTCEADRASLLVSEAKADIAKAENARTKSEQQRIKEKAEDTIKLSQFAARQLCLVSFYKTMYRAYDLISTDFWRYNAIEVILTDDLTDKQMKTVASIMALPYPKWQQVVLFDSNKDLAASLVNSQKQAKALENIINKKSDQEFGELIGKFSDDFIKDVTLFGCVVNQEQKTITCN